MERKIYTYEEAYEASLKYFNNNELSAKVFLDKYSLRDNKQNILEKTPEDMHHRIAKEFARIEKKKFKKPLSEEKIFSYLDRFKYIVPQGSPCYGIGNKDQAVSLSNCFVIPSPLDSYSGILKTDQEIVQISKRRGGIGTDVSLLRPNGTETHNASRTSTGIVPFCGRFSNSLREVGQDGRRGAGMLSCHIEHPQSITPWDDEVDGKPFIVSIRDKDIGNFDISSKYYNPNKVDFCTMKYDRSKVTGANISLRINDKFMIAATEKKGMFTQQWPIDSEDPKVKVKINAEKAWDKIIHSAWQTAEPGILFWDNIIRESVADCYSKFGFKSTTTNPCGEIVLSPYDSCRLLVINLFAFVKNPFTSKAFFDYKEFFEIVKIAQRLMDDLVDLEEEAIIKIIDKVKNDPEDEGTKAIELNLWQKVLKACTDGRRTGTGITALGDVIAALNIGYGSEKGIEETERIYRTLKFGSYTSSVEMAKELGTFPIWDHKLEKDNPFLNRIKKETVKLNDTEEIYGEDLWNDIKKYGRRNIANLTTAPVGSMSLLCLLIDEFGTSSGIEPEYDIVPVERKKRINPSDKNARVDYVDQNGDSWQKFNVYCSALKEWMKVTGETDYKKSPWYGHTASALDWKLRVKLQSVAQKHVDHSISSTVNLPNSVTVDQVKEIYETAWKLGCKGITVYRDLCRIGIITTKEDDKNTKEQIKISNAPKRPDSLECDIHHVKVTKTLDKVRTFEYLVIVGLLDGKPYEVFAVENGILDKKIVKGKLVKQTKGKYDLAVTQDEKEKIIENITKDNAESEDLLTRMVSMNLRHGVPIHFIIQQLEKCGDLGAFNKAVMRSLKKHIVEGTVLDGMYCEECAKNGEKSKMIMQNGCAYCQLNGHSKCG